MKMIAFTETLRTFLPLIILKSISGNRIEIPTVENNNSYYELDLLLSSDNNRDYYENIYAASYYGNSDKSTEKVLSADNSKSEPYRVGAAIKKQPNKQTGKPNRDGAAIKKQANKQTGKPNRDGTAIKKQANKQTCKTNRDGAAIKKQAHKQTGKPNGDGAAIKKQANKQTGKPNRDSFENKIIYEDEVPYSGCLKHTVFVNRNLRKYVNITTFFQEKKIQRRANGFSITDDYNQLIDLNDFKFLINPNACNGYKNGPLLIVIIFSAPGYVEEREVFRNTWAKNVGDDTKVLFLLGTTVHHDKTLEQQIKAESNKFNDIVQGNFIDDYRNLTYKHVMGLKWVFHHCKCAKFILKTDDDVFINMNYLLLVLKERLKKGAKKFLMCNICNRSLVIREKSNKHFVTLSEYQGTYYPRYCQGAVIVYSTDAAFRLLEQCQKMPFFWISDVQVTGVCALQLRLSLEPFGMKKLTEDEASLLEQMGPTSVQSFITGPYHLTLDRIESLCNALHNKTSARPHWF